MKIGKGKEIVVFLDYDGTLSQIVDDPDKAFMSDAVSILHTTINTLYQYYTFRKSLKYRFRNGKG